MSSVTVQDVQIAGTVSLAVAVVVTAVRLTDRLVYRRLWWDDFFALVAMLSVILVGIGMWLIAAPAYAGSESMRIAVVYINATGYYSTVWAARFSILYTIIRVAPFVHHKRVLYCFAASFGLIWVVLLTQFWWKCGLNPNGWMTSPTTPYCWFGDTEAISQLITDVYADLALIFIPLYMLRNVRVDFGKRMRLRAVFVSSIAITITSGFHAPFVIHYIPMMEGLGSIVQDTVSVIVCNLAVIVSMCYRVISKAAREREKTDDLPTNPSGNSFEFRSPFHRSRRWTWRTTITTTDDDLSSEPQSFPVRTRTDIEASGGDSASVLVADSGKTSQSEVDEPSTKSKVVTFVEDESRKSKVVTFARGETESKR